MKRLIFISLGLFFFASPIKAVPIYFVGIGNPTAGDPDMKAVDTMNSILKKIAENLGQQYVSTIIKGSSTANVGGTQISNALNQVKNLAKDGDLVVFYYIGHGNSIDHTAGKEDKTDDSDNASTKGDEFIGTNDDKFTDDQLATVLGDMKSGVHKVALVDSCYSGGMVGGADDLDKSSMLNLAWLLSVPENQADPGLYEYAPWLEEAMEKNSHYKGDKNKDGKVTVGEWLDYGYQKRIDAGTGGSKGYTAWAGSQTTEYVLVPEPATLCLLGLGALGLLRRRKRS